MLAQAGRIFEHPRFRPDHFPKREVRNIFSRSYLNVYGIFGTENDAISWETQPKMSDKIRSYTELWELIRVSLRVQHPEWVEPNGDSPICDSYEARFAQLLDLSHPQKGAPATSGIRREHV
jgi:hypothetical protein